MSADFIQAKRNLDRAIEALEYRADRFCEHMDALGLNKGSDSLWPSVASVRAAFDEMAAVWSDDLNEQVRASEKAFGETVLALLDFTARGGSIIPPTAAE